MADLFEIASRRKYRFPFHGCISVEDLWDLSAKNLDEIYKVLNVEARNTREESLIVANLEDPDLTNRINIVRYIFSVKEAEVSARKAEKERDEKKKRLLEILAQKQDEALLAMSEEELRKTINEL